MRNHVKQETAPIIKRAFLVCLISLKLISPCFASDSYVVSEVIDGDVIALSTGEHVRLIGIDTPLRIPFQTINDERQKASEFSRKLVEGKKVRLEYDVQQRDKDGQILAYVYVFECHNCDVRSLQGYKYVSFGNDLYLFLNATLINSGYAQVMTVAPNVKYQKLFLELQKDARKNERGLWKIPTELKMSKEEAFTLAQDAFKKAGMQWQPQMLDAHEYRSEWILNEKNCLGACLEVVIDKRTRTVEIGTLSSR